MRWPALLVHHRDYACRSILYSGLERLASEIPLMTVEGGDPPKSAACERLSPHAHFGREKATADAVRRWISSGTVTPVVQ